MTKNTNLHTMDVARYARNYWTRYADTLNPYHGVYYSGGVEGDVSTHIKFYKNGSLEAKTTFTEHKGKDKTIKYTGTYAIVKRIGKWRIAQCTINYMSYGGVKQIPSPWKRIILFHGTKNRFAVLESVEQAIADVQKLHADTANEQQQINNDYRKAGATVRPRQNTRYILLDYKDIMPDEVWRSGVVGSGVERGGRAAKLI